MITLSALAALALTIVVLSRCGPTGTTTRGPAGTETVKINGETFHLELAADEPLRTKGLMYRDQIPDHGGMLFVFPDAQVMVQSFWMGNCLVDMDIIYLDRRGFVTATHHMKAEPPRGPNESKSDYDRRMPRYSSAYPAQFAIELKAGSLERLNVKVEQKIDLDVARLKATAH